MSPEAAPDAATGTAPPIVDDGCPPRYTRHGTRCYRLSIPSASWEAAELTCEADAIGAHLVVVDDNSEATLVDRFDIDLWIGASDRVSDGSFLEVTGAAMRFRAWPPGQPSRDADDDCVWFEVLAAPEIFARPCSMPASYLCEYDGVAAADTAYRAAKED